MKSLFTLTTLEGRSTTPIKLGGLYGQTLIIASALENDCNILYSEDMQHGLNIDNQLKIQNPLIS
ncbi:MAG: hypothetical protein H8D22_06750 [Candidatus Cloacimonetes bacterium]|nr:hypothetical protein [Candidatus Cloacimonadota bacterium]